MQPPEAGEFDAIAQQVTQRLARNEMIRRELPGGGRIHIDRQLPFLCIYRIPPERDDTGTGWLVSTEAAYLLMPGSAAYEQPLLLLCDRLAETLAEHFGVYLILELWSRPGGELLPDESPVRPEFRLFSENPQAMPGMLRMFTEALERVQVDGPTALVEVRQDTAPAPPDMAPLFSRGRMQCETCVTLGLEVRPIYRGTAGQLFPFVLRRLRRQLSLAVRKAIYGFCGSRTDLPLVHFHSLGPSYLEKTVQLVDQQLTKVADSFDFILQATPVNAEQSWEQFRTSRFQSPPQFRYRPLPHDTNELKRRLFAIPCQQVEDPAVAHLMLSKQMELDRQLTAMHDLGTRNFLYGSLQLYGQPDDDLARLAKRLLAASLKARAEADEDGGPPDSSEVWLDTEQVFERARRMIRLYSQQYEKFSPRIEQRQDIASQIMVSQGSLLISPTLRLRAERAEALMHHEVGTHLLTYFNGQAQPLGQLHAGLAGYEVLQEGLAVLSEYLVGALDWNRIRMLAGRVVAVEALVQGASFLDCFRLLTGEYGFTPRRAFTLALRVYRGGGLTKDAIYLQGLQQVTRYLADGHDLEPLFIGKFGLHQLPFIRELRRRNVLVPAAVLPAYLEDPDAQARLEACRSRSISELLGV